MANTVLAGDYSGLISFKGDKKGLLITENKFFGAKKTFINKTTVDHYELVMQEAELAPSLELTPPKRTAITLSRSSSKTGLRLCVLLTPTTTKPSSASCTEVQMEKLAPTRSGLFICPFRPASPRLGTARCPCPCYTAHTVSDFVAIPALISEYILSSSSLKRPKSKSPHFRISESPSAACR